MSTRTQIASNPFEFDAALNLPEDALVDWYIEDHNFARFLRSTRNLLVNGQRGSGKSMMLIYNSLKLQRLRHDRKGDLFPPTHVGIYVPCNTPLTHRQDHELLPASQQVMLSEFYFVMAIAEAIAGTFEETSVGFTPEDYILLTDEIRAVLPQLVVQEREKIFTCLRRSINEQLGNLQRSLQHGLESDAEYGAVSFYSFVKPILAALNRTSVFLHSHFSILVDDAHDLNQHQRRLLNSWLSYRDHSVFSFKVAIAGVRAYDLRTLSGGTILEGHDYLSIDLEAPFQNEDSSYAQFAQEVVKQRLTGIGLDVTTADEFFPQSEEFSRDLARANDEVRIAYMKTQGWVVEDLESLSHEQQKAIRDHVYKYGRAKYFRDRKNKANLPTYAGFETIVHLSTGVVRNLLAPCYKMFDAAVSDTRGEQPKIIAPHLQSEIVKAQSDELWIKIRSGLETIVEGCTRDDAIHLENLFTALGDYFVWRLMHHKSEPRVLSFTISEQTSENMEFLMRLVGIAQEAQLLYVRSGSAKMRGRREDYYTPNRLFWPILGLDVNGQHGRASIPSKDLVLAAKQKVAIKRGATEGDDNAQLVLV